MNNHNMNHYNIYNHYNHKTYNINNTNNTLKGTWDNNNGKTFSKFRNSFTYNQRINESNRIIQKYPDRIPIICEKGLGKDNPDIDKNKYLVPLDFTIGNFLVVVRKKIKLQDYEALFLMINGSIPSTTSTFRDIYHSYKDSDGYLYITYTKENVFG